MLLYLESICWAICIIRLLSRDVMPSARIQLVFLRGYRTAFAFDSGIFGALKENAYGRPGVGAFWHPFCQYRAAGRCDFEYPAVYSHGIFAACSVVVPGAGKMDVEDTAGWICGVAPDGNRTAHPAPGMV